MAWLTGWNRRKSKIINGSTTVQANYQMQLTVHKGTGTDIATDIYLGTNVRDDFGDVRFTKSDGSTLLNYWIDPSTLISGTSATFWIQIDSIPTTGTTIYVYYDNPSQTTISNGTNTFDAFDLNTFTLYNPGGDLTVESSSKVSWTSKNLYTSTARLYKSISSRSDFALEYESHDDARQHYSVGFADSVSNYPTISNGIYARDTTPGGAIGTVIEHMTSGSPLYSSGYTAQGTALCYNRFTRLGTSVILSMFSDAARTIHVPGSPVTYTDTLPVAVTYFYAITGIGSSSGGDAQSGYLQNFRVRKYSSPEPTFGSSGTEETPALITAIDPMIITTSQTPCLYGTCTVTVTVTWQNQGGTTGSFVPSLTIDGTLFAPYPSEDLGPGASVIHAFDITTLAVGTHEICPNPN